MIPVPKIPREDHPSLPLMMPVSMSMLMLMNTIPRENETPPSADRRMNDFAPLPGRPRNQNAMRNPAI
jgi:hypothetical protein